MTEAPRQLRLRVTSDPANLAPVRHEVESFARACGFDEAARGEIVLCVNEAMTNITRHAYDGATDQPIELSATFADDLLRITVRDWGAGRTPRPCDQSHDPLRPGGVGMLCLRELMDRITFTPQTDGMLLVMERKLE
ncbi:MAG TPA: ATP-binding protein [Tepidisphaeraceae bacterium]|jgi:serine/threonine-protein kinase RsbW